MKNLRLLSLAAVAAMALMAFAASSASATALYNGATKLGVGSELDFSLKSGTSAMLTETTAEGGELDKCTGSTVRGSISNAGGATATVSGNIADEVKESKTVTGLTWTGCTFPTTTTLPGGLEVHQIGTTTNGTITASADMAWTVSSIIYGSCVWGVTKGADLGELTTTASGTAQLDTHFMLEKFSGSNFACPATAVLAATYVSTTPDNLRVEAS